MVRIVQMPSGFDTPNKYFPTETRRLYKRLIERGRPVRVWFVDEWKTPWISCRFRDKKGNWEWHSLAIDDDSWVRVKHRAKPKKPS
jgi:hypothetical protein